MEVEPAYPGRSEDVEQPATGKGTDNSQEDIEQDALTSPVYQLAGDIPRHQAEANPGQKRHRFSRLSRRKTERGEGTAVSASCP